jgi:hypothetical protein
MECIKFLDGKPVYMLSTVHGSDMSATRRRHKDTNVIIMKPSMVVNYRNSQNMEDHLFQPFKRLYDAICVRYHLIWSVNPTHILIVVDYHAWFHYNHICILMPTARGWHKQLERLTGRHFISKIKTNGKKRNLARFCKVCNEAERNNAELSAQKRKRPSHETATGRNFIISMSPALCSCCLK